MIKNNQIIKNKIKQDKNKKNFINNKDYIRVNYKTQNGIDGIGIWIFKDAKYVSYNWPKGAFVFNKSYNYQNLYYIDIMLNEDFKELGFIIVNRRTGEKLTEDIIIDKDINYRNEIFLKENDNTVYYNRHFINNNNYFSVSSYKLKDDLFFYDGNDLGAIVQENEKVQFKVWAPSADNVFTVLYDKKNSEIELAVTIKMERIERGVYRGQVDPRDLGIKTLDGYYYQYKIERDGRYRYALDPYAKSMAPWNYKDGHKTGKGAIIKDIKSNEIKNYKIEGFINKEDAIIYETSIRDFTSDPDIKDELKNEFKTFDAFIEKLDYIKDLGVTHIQFLPIMSFYTANETKDRDRILTNDIMGTDYNWGYDPYSYFSITGLYSKDPYDARKRIYEFMNLINEIHKRGMGVIMDVVYNHTAKVHLLNSLEPDYYYFMDNKGKAKTSFGGGRLGTTHLMSRKLVLDSIEYFTRDFSIDGFRFDMMGDHDSETIDLAYNIAKNINPNIIFIGEGWRTYAGDDDDKDIIPADQDWIKNTDSVGSFSDEYRNEFKSGYGSEGSRRFLTGGKRNIKRIFNNIKGKPSNFEGKRPSGIVSYLESHDNLTLHDVIAKSIKKDPEIHKEEIFKRIRLGNLILLTSQGICFIHSGQEYGRTKQFKVTGFEEKAKDTPYKSTFMTDEKGNPFTYPYFIHDSYKASDYINRFEWQKTRDRINYSENILTKDYVKGLISLRRDSDAFRLSSYEEIDKNIKLINIKNTKDWDLLLGYSAMSNVKDETYYVFINADEIKREITVNESIDFKSMDIIVDQKNSGIDRIEKPHGIELITSNKIIIEPLTGIIFRTN